MAPRSTTSATARSRLTLYRLVLQHAASFNAHTESSTGAELPRFIKDEFDAFLECGILAQGFLRLRCGDCGHDKLLAFTCKRRGFCPSCDARRMSQTAAHLVDHIIPHVPVRQWVLSVPIPLRLLLPSQPQLVTPVLQVVQRVVTRHLLGRAGLKADEGHGGAVTLIQRFGSAANLNIHLHCLVLDGVYMCGGDGVPSFVEVDAPTDDELHTLLQTLIPRLMKPLTRRGVLIEEMGQTYLAEPDADGDEGALRPLQPAAVTYRSAFGPRAGHKVLPLRGAMPRESPRSQPPCADIDGFSLAPSPLGVPPVAEFDSGGGGSYGSIQDYARFVQAWLNGGVGVLQPATAQMALQNHIGTIQLPALMKSTVPELSNDVPVLPVPQAWGLGFHLTLADLPGMRSHGTGDWAGVFNSYYWIDQRKGIGGVLMTQLLPFFDLPVVQTLLGFETAVYQQVGAAVPA